MKRREVLGGLAMVGVAAAWPEWTRAAEAQTATPIPRKGRIRQGLWPKNFGTLGTAEGISPVEMAKRVETMCEIAVHVGAHGFDILPPFTWPVQRRFGLTPILAGSGELDFETGIVHADANDAQFAALAANAKVCAGAGVARFAVNAGQRRGLSYAEAANNAVALFKRLKDTLEALNVTACLENVNDRRRTDLGLSHQELGRQDMAFGHWDWGMDVITRVGSPRVKLLCDIYHLQIMDGDVAWRIRESIGSIGHFHVAGVPTRAEIDDTQELNFRYIAQVIAALPYDGYVSHEWTPSPGHDPIKSIEQAMAIMDV